MSSFNTGILVMIAWTVYFMPEAIGWNAIRSSPAVNITTCISSYVKCLDSRQYMILPFSVDHGNLIAFCEQKKYIDECMGQNIGMEFMSCAKKIRSHTENKQQNDSSMHNIFWSEYVSRAQRIYYWLCDKFFEEIIDWRQPTCFLRKFFSCVLLMNDTLCELPCEDHLFFTPWQLYSLWYRRYVNVEYNTSSVSMAECYDDFLNCSTFHKYMLLPYDVDHANIVMFCLQKHFIDICMKERSPQHFDFHTCGYLAHISKNKTREVQLLSYGYRIHRYICEKHGYLVPGWTNPACFMEKFHYCVDEFDEALCAEYCDPIDPEEVVMKHVYITDQAHRHENRCLLTLVAIGFTALIANSRNIFL